MEENREYKVGDKVFVEAEILDVRETTPGRYKVASSSFEYDPKSTLMPRHIYADRVYSIPDKTYEDGMAAAGGGILRDISKMDETTREDYFGNHWIENIVERFTPAEAAEKIKAWEDAKDIHTNDEVYDVYGNTGVVTNVGFPDTDNIYVLWKDGSAHRLKKNDLTKTGRTINVQNILDQLSEKR